MTDVRWVVVSITISKEVIVGIRGKIKNMTE